MTFISNPLALLATACPIFPIPKIPKVFPVTSVPRKNNGAQPVKPPARVNLSPSTTRRAIPKINAQVISAVAFVDTFGVFVTGIFNSVAVARSILLNPAP